MKKNFFKISKSLSMGKISGALALGIFLLASGQTGCAAGTQPDPATVDRFAIIDANKDGKIVAEEFQKAFPNMNENAFVVIDKNGDKGIDKLEWVEFMENHGKPSHERGAPMNNIPGDPLIPPPDSNDLPLMTPSNL